MAYLPLATPPFLSVGYLKVLYPLSQFEAAAIGKSCHASVFPDVSLSRE